MTRRGRAARATRCPRLQLSVVLRTDARQVARAAERATTGDRGAAKEQFDALLHVDPSPLKRRSARRSRRGPSGRSTSSASSRAEYPESALVHLHLGLALYAGGDDTAALPSGERRSKSSRTRRRLCAPRICSTPIWRLDGRSSIPSFAPTLDLENDSPAAQLAGAAPPGHEGRRARTISSTASRSSASDARCPPGSPSRALSSSTERASTHASRMLSAVSTRTSRREAFSRLGPLAQAHPRSPLVRFHLGLLLLWIRDVENARKQLQRAADADRDGFYGREARALLSRLEAIGT